MTALDGALRRLEPGPSPSKPLSKERGLPAGELVRDSLKRHLAVERFRALRGKVLPFAEAEGFLADEDVFKAIS
ncbi:MAG TPA: hypothetical protein VFF02_14135 [Anaeromyxobacteraceae bacterium]|nr:hypothetical protein [Anaeromyxobacteraceae bacterium]